MSKNSNLMQFYKINVCHVMIFRLHAVYDKHELMKLGNQSKEKLQYYHKCSNNFAADCTIHDQSCNLTTVAGETKHYPMGITLIGGISS